MALLAAGGLLILARLYTAPDAPKPEPPATAEEAPEPAEAPRAASGPAAPPATAPLAEPSPEPEAPAGSEGWALRCPISLDAPFTGEVEFVEMIQLDGGGVMPTRRAAWLSGGALIAAAGDPEHGGWFEIPGYPDLDWKPAEGGGCPELALEGRSGVVGTVRPAGGDVRVRACGTSRDAEEDGSFYVPADPGPCTVSASRSDGVVIVEGDSFAVDVPEGSDVVIDLTVPEAEWGSVGLWLEGEDPVRIAHVIAGSPADEAGLEAGLTVLSIDGEDPAGCDRGWLFNCLHGPIGEGVRLELEDETIEVDRGPIEEMR